MAKNKLVKKGKWWFRGLKRLMTMRYKSPKFVFLDGKPFEDGSMILSNHEGTDAPMSLEMYLNKPLRMWGTHEMNSGLRKMYSYQTRVYYHEKKHWNIHLARLFCLLASPLTYMFYSGFNLISTYRDARFIKTIKESQETLKNGESIVIYPEDSKNGYLKELEGFFAGFAVFAEACLKKGLDVPVVVSYFKKNEKVYIFDKTVMYSELVNECGSRENIIQRLLKRCNELGEMTEEDYKIYINKDEENVA